MAAPDIYVPKSQVEEGNAKKVFENFVWVSSVLAGGFIIAILSDYASESRMITLFFIVISNIVINVVTRSIEDTLRTYASSTFDNAVKTIFSFFAFIKAVASTVLLVYLVGLIKIYWGEGHLNGIEVSGLILNMTIIAVIASSCIEDYLNLPKKKLKE